MKRFLIFLVLIPSLVIAAGFSGSQTLRNVARAWLLDPPAQNTFVPSQYGIGWSDSKFTVRTPPGNLQFDVTGDPEEPVMTWPGRIVADHIDVTSMSLYTSPPLTSSSPGTPGQKAYDANYEYTCVALNTWKRVALNSF